MFRYQIYGKFTLNTLHTFIQNSKSAKYKWLFEDRIAFLLLAVIYPAWVPLLNWIDYPGFLDSFQERLAIGVCSLVIFILTYQFSWFRKNSSMLMLAAAVVVTTHNFYYVYLNTMSVLYAIGIFITIFSIAAFINEVTHMIMYSVAVLIASYFFSEPAPQKMRIFFIFGIVSALFVSSIATFRRMRLLQREVESRAVIENQQAQLANSSRLSALGDMAGGMAHEINTPLTSILLRAEILLGLIAKKTIDPNSFATALQVISTNALKIANIISSLRYFAKDGSADEVCTVSAEKLMRDCLFLCESKLTSLGIEIIFEAPAEVFNVKVRPVQLSQSLMHILSNAQHAVKDTVYPKIWINIYRTKLETCIAITDNGHGISEEFKDKIFQPFMTTRPVGSGMGLGLSAARGIVETVGGGLTLEESNVGTRFLISLPNI